jgi:hypothetical protein
MKTFAEFLKPVRKHLLELTGQSDQLTEHVHRRGAGPLPGDSGLHVQFAFIGRRRDVGAISKRNILQSQRESLPQQDWNARYTGHLPIGGTGFIAATVYRAWRMTAAMPIKLKQISERQIIVVIQPKQGTDSSDAFEQAMGFHSRATFP